MQIGIEGIFSDHAATVTFYANCVLRPAHSTCFGTKQPCGCDAESLKERCSVGAIRSPTAVLNVNLRRTSTLASLKFRQAGGRNTSASTEYMQMQNLHQEALDGLEVSLASDTIVSNCLITPLAPNQPRFDQPRPEQSWFGVVPIGGLICSNPGQYLKVRPPTVTAAMASASNPLFVEVCIFDQDVSIPQATVWV